MKKILIATLSLFMAYSLQAQVDRSQPKPGPAPKVNIGKPQTFTLPNGLTVLVVENNKLPRVTASLTIDNAPYAEGSKAGLSDLTGALMGNGTSKISKDAYNEEVEFYGASLNLSVNGGYATSLTKYFPRVLELMALGAIDPLFTQEEFDKEKAKFIEGLKADEKSARSVAARVENVLAFGKNHPFGEFVTEETLNNISLADVKRHYANFFSPNNAYLTIVGDIKFKDAKKLVEKHFKGWKKGNSPKIEYTDPKDVQYTQINFVDMPNATQSEISLVNLHKLRMTDKDYFAVLMANHILGGGGEGYLFLNLRETNGWTYGAYSGIGPTRYISSFSASASVKSTATDSAVVEFLKEIKRIRTEKVKEEDLATAKAKYVGNFVMQVENPQTVARYALNTKLYNLSDDFYQNFIANINAVTAEDVQRVAQKYFSYDNSRIVIVGKGSEVIEPLEKLGIPMFYFDKYGNPTEKPQAKEVDPSITPKVVLDNFIKAIGGTDAVYKVKTVAMTGSATIPGAPAPISVNIKRAEGKFMQDITMQGMSLSKTVINGNKGYMSGQGQKQDFTAEEVAESKAEAAPIAELVLLNDANLTIKGIETVDGKDAYVLESGNNSYYYDVESGLKVAEGKTAEMMGQTMTSMTYFKDYKAVKGVQMYHTIVQNLGFDLEVKISEIKINEGVSEADFK